MQTELALTFDVDRDRPKLEKLREKNIWIGTSSWKYQGWLGKVYRADYSGARSSFVKKRFETEALTEYSRVFPTVCFDGAYWRLPEPESFKRYSEEIPEEYQFTMKVTDLLTQRRFNAGPRKGEMNPSFLDVRTFTDHFLEPVSHILGEKLGVLIFEFSPFHFSRPFGLKDGYQPIDFVKDLHRFFDALPKSSNVKLAVEVRDHEFIDPRFTRYLDCLGYHGVAHVLNEQTWMPELHEQLDVPGIFTSDFTVVRALVRPGVSHEQAVREFEPYTHVTRPLPQMRRALAETIAHSIENRRGLYMYVNNRAEGNSPDTIANVLTLFEQDFVTQ
jgi:uncharacterized protein YecE (DUF72 family)